MKYTNHRGTPQAGVGGRQQRRGRRWPIAGALTAALFAPALLAAGGCSPGPATAGSGTGQSQSQADQAMVSFTRCMRAHGVQMSDPYERPGHSGLTLDLPPQDDATRAAYAACNHWIAPIVQAKLSGMAAQASSRLPGLTRYAECMRARDIPVLDPNQQGEVDMGNLPGMLNNVGRYSPQFRSADAACRHLLPAGVTDDGSGP